MNKYIYIFIMALTTFGIRILPFSIIRKPIKNQFIRSFLYYVPYVTIAVMTFPAIIQAADNIWSGITALVVGIIAAWIGLNMVCCSLICCLVVFIASYI